MRPLGILHSSSPQFFLNYQHKPAVNTHDLHQTRKEARHQIRHLASVYFTASNARLFGALLGLLVVRPQLHHFAMRLIGYLRQQ